MEGSSTPPVRRRRWPLILLAIFLVPALILAFLWFGIPPNVPGGPIRLLRDDNGRLVPVKPSEGENTVTFDFHAARIDAQNNFNSSSRSTHTDPSGFACRRFVIINLSDHLLMKRIGQRLLEEFKSLDYADQIDYYPLGFTPEEGELAPDIVITLDITSIKESRWPGIHSLEATLAVTAGNGPPDCPTSYSDHLTPPIDQFDWNGDLFHKSTTTGLASSAAKYKLAADNIAKQIGNTLRKEFDKRRENKGVLPKLSTVFYPPYHKSPAFQFDRFGVPKLVASWHGLMNHNETLWRLTIDKNAADVLGDIPRELKKSGWESGHSNPERFLRMTRDDAVLLVYAPQSRELQISHEVSVSGGNLENINADELKKLIEGVLKFKVCLRSISLVRSRCHNGGYNEREVDMQRSPRAFEFGCC